MRNTSDQPSRQEVLSVLGAAPQASLVFFADRSNCFARAYFEATNHPWFHVALAFNPTRKHFTGYYFECTSGVFHPTRPSGWTGPYFTLTLESWRNEDRLYRNLAFRNLKLSPHEAATSLNKAFKAVGHIRYAELALLRLSLSTQLGINIPAQIRSPHWATCSEAVILMLPARLQRLLGVNRKNKPDDVFPSGGPGLDLWSLCNRIDAS